MSITRDDVVQAYKFLLLREPESENQIASKLAYGFRDLNELILHIRSSDEFAAMARLELGANVKKNRKLILDGVFEKTRTVCIYGSCLSEVLNSKARNLGWESEHYLYSSFDHEIPVTPQSENMDAVIVSLTLRTIIGRSAEVIYGNFNRDLAYFKDNETDRLLDECKNIIQRCIKNFSNSAFKCPIFVLSFIEPASVSSGLFFARNRNGMYRIVRELNDYLSEIVSQDDNLYFLEINDLMHSYNLGTPDEGRYLCYAHAGVDGAGLITQAVLGRLEKMVEIINNNNKIKLIITDLDGVLWKGILAEEDVIVPDEQIEGWPIGYVEALLECKRRGIMLAICSKNDAELTMVNFTKVWGDQISINDFCSVKINWLPKSENVSSILAEVNVLPEHVLFIDDNPIEILDVTSAYPQIRTLTGNPSLWRAELLFSIPLQVAHIGAESARRTELIKAQIAINENINSSNREQFLCDINISVRISEVSHQYDYGFRRALELLNKTNQFNTTGVRWGANTLTEFVSNGSKIFVMEVSDRGTNHGLVGVVLVENDTIIQMVLSCRVFGLNLEDAFLLWLIDNISSTFSLKFLDTGKNSTARQFVDSYFSRIEDEFILSKIPKKVNHVGFK